MKIRNIVLIVIISVLFYSCSNSTVSSNQNNSNIENQGVKSQNIIVKNPSKGKITYEIDESLIGKYVVDDDPKEYFAINSDGTVEISINAMSGYAHYTSEAIRLKAYYTDEKTILSFELINGDFTFPEDGLSYELEGFENENRNIFTDLKYGEVKYVKET